MIVILRFVLIPEEEIFRNGKVRDHGVFMAVRRDIADPQFLPLFYRHLPCFRTVDEKRSLFHLFISDDQSFQFLLPVAVYACDPQYLAGMDRQAYGLLRFL